MSTPTLKTTPLHRAVLLGDMKEVMNLVDLGAPVSAVDANANTPLHLAFILKHYGMVDPLLTALQYSFADLENENTNVINRQGLSHFHIACTTSKKQIIWQYLEDGAHVDAKVDHDALVWAGYTALHFAASFKSFVATEILMKFGADCNITEANGKTPLELANEVLIQSAMVVDALSKTNYGYYNDMSYFHTACLKKDTASLQKFIENGVNLNTPLKYQVPCNFNPKYTALHFAVLSKNLHGVDLLLHHGADPTCVCDRYQTPLHLAMYDEQFGRKNRIVEVLYNALLQREGDENLIMVDMNKLGFFHVAITRNNLHLVEKSLHDFKEDVNRPLLYDTPNFPGYAPLHFAVRYGLYEMTQLLIKRGANVNYVSGDGTPLHIAFHVNFPNQVGQVNLIKLLLKKGADARAVRFKDKKTMLHLLVERYVSVKGSQLRYDIEYEENEKLLGYISELVCKYGVDVNALSREFPRLGYNNTALHIAYRNLPLAGPCLKLLLENGADINVTNIQDCLPFTKYKLQFLSDNNYADFLLIYHHIHNLKALGLPLDEYNIEWCQEFIRIRNESNLKVEELNDQTLAQVERQRLQEIYIMKKAKVDRDMSLFDILVHDKTTHPQEIVLPKNFKFTLMKSGRFTTLYPRYGYLIQFKLNKLQSA